MSHIDFYNNHAIHESLRIALQLVSEEISSEGLGIEQFNHLDRMNHVLQTLKTEFEVADPLMISTGILDNMNNQLQSISSYLRDFKTSRNAVQITNAISYLDAICQNIQFIYIPASVNELESIRDSAVSFRQSLGQHLRHATKEIDDQKAVVQKLIEEVDDLKQRINSEKSRVDSITSDYQRQFSESEAERQREYSRKYQEEVDKIKEKYAALESSLEENRINIVQRSEEIITKINNHQAEAKRILGTMSVDGHAAGYKIEADKARKAKNMWQWVTVVLFGLLIISTLVNAILSNGDFSWIKFASKWSITLAIGAAVTYSAKQAAKQDQIERENKNMELQMATIDPYLEIFQEDERKEIKKMLVDRIFTGVERKKQEEKGTAVIPTSEIPKLIESFAGFVKKISG